MQGPFECAFLSRGVAVVQSIRGCRGVVAGVHSQLGADLTTSVIIAVAAGVGLLETGAIAPHEGIVIPNRIRTIRTDVTV
jgi:hypothetical protein